MDNNDLLNLPNIGEVLKEKLISVGIDTSEKLIETGSVNAYWQLKAQGLDPCYNTLYALEGAVRGIRWHLLGKAELQKLKEQVSNEHKEL